jgi:hypothetical protein
MEATEYYTVLADIQKRNREGTLKGGLDDILERILNLALTDKDLKKTSDSIGELEAEIDKFGGMGDTFKYSDLSKSLIEGLKAQRENLIKRAGQMAKNKLEFENGQLKDLRGKGLRIKFETTAKEKDFLEQTLSAEQQQEIVKKYKYTYGVGDDQLYWPYAGEYWRDELGTYQYTLTKGCVDKESGSTGGRGE